MAMAATAAVQQTAVLVGVTVVSVGTSGESGGGQQQGMRVGGLQVSPRAHLVSARPGQSHQTHPAHPRLAAFSSFFGAGLDPCVLRASNVSLRFVSNHPPFACPCIASALGLYENTLKNQAKLRKAVLSMLVFFRCLLHSSSYLHFLMVDVHVLEISLFSSGNLVWKQKRIFFG